MFFFCIDVGLHLRSAEHLQQDLLLPLVNLQYENDQRRTLLDPLNHNLRQNQFSGNSIRLSMSVANCTSGFRESGEYVGMRSSTNATSILNSDILGIRITNEQSIPLRLTQPEANLQQEDFAATTSSQPLLLLNFRHLLTANVSQPRCVYWNNELRSWSGHGCLLLRNNRTHSSCGCEHVHGHFALLMEISELGTNFASGSFNSNSPSSASTVTGGNSFNSFVATAGMSIITSGNGIDRSLSNAFRVWLLVGAVISAFLCVATLISLCTRFTSSQPALGLFHNRGCVGGACAYAGAKPIGRSRQLQRQLSIWLLGQQLCFIAMLSLPGSAVSAFVAGCSAAGVGWYLLIAWHFCTFATFVSLMCAAFELNRLVRGPVNGNGNSGALQLLYTCAPGALAAGFLSTIGWLFGICSVDGRFQISALLLLSALFTLIGSLSFAIASWRRLRWLHQSGSSNASSSTTDLGVLKYATGPLVPPVGAQSIAVGCHPSLGSLVVSNTVCKGSYIGCASRKPRLLLFANLSMTLLCIANATLFTLFTSNQFRRLDALLALCNGFVGPLLFTGYCLSRSQVRHRIAEIFGRLRRKLNCFRRASKSNLLGGGTLETTSATTGSVAGRKSSSVIDNPLIGGQLSGNKYILDSAATIETGSDYGCRRLQMNSNIVSGISSNNNSSTSGQVGIVTSVNGQLVQQTSNQHLYQLYGGKAVGCNAFSACSHGVIEHVYECIDEEPYVAKLLMAAAAANKGQPVAVSYGGQGNGKLLTYRTLQMPHHCTAVGSSSSAQNGAHLSSNVSSDCPLIASQQSLGAARLAILPAIVKDNNGRTTIICARSSSDLHESVESTPGGPMASKVMLNTSAADQGIDI